MTSSCRLPGTFMAITLALFGPGLNASVSERVLNNGQLVLQDVPEIPPDLAARLEQYQNVRSATFVDWTDDGEGIFIKTRFTDTFQLHRVRTPGGTRTQLTYFEEPIGEVQRQERGRRIAFTMDRGGSEDSQIFLLDTATGAARMLTDGESRNRILVWNSQGTRIAFQTTRRNGRDNDVWMMDPDNPGSAEPVHEADDGAWWGPGDFSEDGRYLLLQQYISVEDSRIYLKDLRTGEMRLLAGSAQNPSANRVVAFGGEEVGFYFITNQRGLAAELAWRPLARDRATKFISAGIPWDVSEFAISDDGRRGAFVTNEEGISRLYLLDTRTQDYAAMTDLPVGVIFGLSFNPDNRRLAMTMNTPQTPSDVFVMELGRRAIRGGPVTRWTFSEVGGLDTERFISPRLFRYPTFDSREDSPRHVPAFIYRPHGDGPHPVVIYIHGGPESQYRPVFNSTFQMWLAELGAAVIAPNVRGSLGYGYEYLSLDDGFRREDAVRDVGALLDWIAQQPDLDPQRVAVYGGSYGGYMALASGVHYSDRLAAAVDVVGISNFVTFLENTQDYRRDLRRAEYGDERQSDMREFLQRISPLTNAGRISIPLLVVQGENDPRVPASEAVQIVEALRQREVPVWYMNALNEGHGYARKENRDVYQQAVVLFFQRYLVN